MVTLNSIKRGHFDDSRWHEKHWRQVKERSFYPLQKDNTNISHDVPFLIFSFWLVLKVTFHSIKCWHVEEVFCSLDSYPYILIISHKKKCILTMIWNENVIKAYSFHTPDNKNKRVKACRNKTWNYNHHDVLLLSINIQANVEMILIFGKKLASK